MTTMVETGDRVAIVRGKYPGNIGVAGRTTRMKATVVIQEGSDLNLREVQVMKTSLRVLPLAPPVIPSQGHNQCGDDQGERSQSPPMESPRTANQGDSAADDISSLRSEIRSLKEEVRLLRQQLSQLRFN